VTIKTQTRPLLRVGLLVVFIGIGAGVARTVSQRREINQVVATVSVDQGPLISALDGHLGRMFIGQGTTSDVGVLDVTRGMLVGTIAVAPTTGTEQIVDLNVDEQLHRLFVLTIPMIASAPFHGYINAFDASSKRQIYRVPVALGGTDGIVVIEPQTQRLAVLSFPNYLPNGVTSDPRRDMVYLTILNAESGRLVRTLGLHPPHRTTGGDGSSVGAPIAVDARTDQLYISAFDRSGVAIFNAIDGHLVRTAAIPHFTPTQGARLMGSAIIVNEQLERVYIVDTTPGKGTLTTLDAGTAQVLHAVPIDVSTPPVIDVRTRRVFIIDRRNGRVGILDALSGHMLGVTGVQIAPPQAPTSGMVVDTRSGRLFVLDQRRAMLSILDGTSGHLLHTVALGANPIGLAVDEHSGCVLVTTVGLLDGMRRPTGAGHVEVLDERTGMHIGPITTVGVAPYAVSIIPDAKRALVYNAGGTLRTADPWDRIPDWLRRALPFLPRPTANLRIVPSSVSVLDTSHC